MLPTVDLCGIEVSRLMIGGNPFSGFSHQTPERDQEMMDYYTADRMKEALRRAEAAGINTSIMRSDLHIERIVREYYNEGGTIQWIMQIGDGPDRFRRFAQTGTGLGAKAGYVHGGIVDKAYAEKDAETLRELLGYLHDCGIPAGVAGHAPQAHEWVYESDLPVDFHVVAFYNCGSLHDGKGEKFSPEDPVPATETIRAIDKPCIGYKIMAAGRVDAREAFEFALSNIKPTDCVNVGMYLGDNPNMVEDNVEMVCDILG